MNSFYNREELEEIGFSSIGSNVLISRKASIFAPELINIGSNVRIDDFCILSGIVTLGNYIHISAYTALYGSDIGIIVEDYSTISTRCTIFAASDDYSGEYLGNSAVPDFCRNVIKKKVVIKKFSTLGCGSVLLPGAKLEEGACVGAMSLVKDVIPEYMIYAGVPVHRIGERSKEMLRFIKDIEETVIS